MRDFSETLAGANLNGKWGFIDLNGNEIIPHQYRAVKSFKNGFAFGQKFNFNWQCLNSFNKVLYEFSDIDDFKFNGAYLAYRKDGKWGLKTIDNQDLLACEYDMIKINTSTALLFKNQEWFLFDYSRKQNFKNGYDKIYMSENQFLRVKKNGQFGYIDKQNNLKIGLHFDRASDFNEEVAMVKQENRMFFIGLNGKKKMEVQYEKLIPINEGKWAYFENGYWGIIGRDLQKLTEAKYKYVNKYCEGILGFGVSKDNWGYIDSTGKEFIPAILPIIWDYKNAYARIIDRSGMGMLNDRGEISIAPKYNDIRDFNEGRARVQLR